MLTVPEASMFNAQEAASVPKPSLALVKEAMLTGLMRCHLPRIYLASSYFITLFLYFLQQVLTFPQYTYVIIAEFAGLFYLCLRRCAILNINSL